MKTRPLFTVCALSTAAFAQWPPHESPAMPRLPDGKPNLTAPAPRTADGKPDLSGVWQYMRPPDAPPREERPGIMNCDAREQFCNIGAGLKGGLPLQPWAAELRAKRLADNSKDNPDSHCFPLGLMQFHTHPYPRKMIQTPNLIVILNEANQGVRRIFIDGRPMPRFDSRESPEPWWYGYSAGHWDGDTLIVESAGFRDLGWLDFQGSPLTEAGKFTERFHRVDYGHLDIQVTVDDPKAYTRPWTVTVHQSIVTDADLIEFVCLENNRDEGHLVGK